jgi:hypothetical protein
MSFRFRQVFWSFIKSVQSFSFSGFVLPKFLSVQLVIHVSGLALLFKKQDYCFHSGTRKRFHLVNLNRMQVAVFLVLLT